MELVDANSRFGEMLIKFPMKMFPLLDSGLIKAQREMQNSLSQLDNISIKLNVHVRIADVPVISEIALPKYPRCKDLGKLVCLSGTVIRTGLIKMMETFRVYECSNCKKIVRMDSDDLLFGSIPKPSSCQGNMGKSKCHSVKYNLIPQDQANSCIDYQEIKIQEQVGKLTIGTVKSII